MNSTALIMIFVVLLTMFIIVRRTSEPRFSSDPNKYRIKRCKTIDDKYVYQAFGTPDNLLMNERLIVHYPSSYCFCYEGENGEKIDYAYNTFDDALSACVEECKISRSVTMGTYETEMIKSVIIKNSLNNR